jgi:hypothetical protein
MMHARVYRLLLAGEAVMLALSLAYPAYSQADAPSVVVHLDASKAGPRKVEDATARRVVADYRLAWTSLAQAMEADTPDPVQGLFAGTAMKWLTDTVASERQSGLRTNYLNQDHKLEAVFYAPEGDVIELHDTADYQMQVFDNGKMIHDEHVVMHYVVLMTPAADRWVVRELQAVPQF